MTTNDTPTPSSIAPAEASDPVAGRCAVAAGWPSEPAARNQLVGDALGMKPLTQCWIGVGGKRLLQTRWDESQRSEAEAMARLMQTYDKIWDESLADYPSLKPEMRGKLEVVIDRWHMRYSDTPGGGWEVIEWLRMLGTIKIESDLDQWRVEFDDAHPHHGRVVEIESTMAEAACRVALRVARAANTKDEPHP